MMVQNAAFIPDAMPAPAAQGGMANAAAGPGAGLFQQLLQDRRSPETPAQQGPAAQRPAPAKPLRSSSVQDKRTGKSEPAQAAPTEKGDAGKAKVKGHDAPVKEAEQKQEKGAVQETAAEPEPASAAKDAEGGGQVQESAAGEEAAQEPTVTQQAKPEPNPGLVVAMAAVESAMAARSNGAGSEAGATAVQKLEGLQKRLAQEPAVQPDADANAMQPAPQQQVTQQQGTQQQVTQQVAQPQVAQQQVAQQQVAQQQVAQQQVAQQQVAQQQVAQQQVVQQQVVQQPVVQQQVAQQQVAQQQVAQQQVVQQQVVQQQVVQQQGQSTGNSSGLKLSQKAESAQLPRQERTEVVASTGATEGAQVEKAQVPPAQEKASQQQGPVLPEAAKTAVAADQSVAAAHLTAKDSGAGRFVAMPVRNLSADQAQPLAGADAAVTVTVQENAPAEQVAVATPAPAEPAAVAGSAATPVEAKAETAVQGKAVQHEVKETVQPEQQAAPGAVSGKEAGQAAEPQRREVRAADGAHGREVREAAQAQQVNPGRVAAEEVSGTKGATTASATVLSAEKTVQEGQGAQGGQGESQQKGADNHNAQMLGAGMTGQANQAESAQAETRQAAKSPLHESILSQVREGVVTHDGKGNGQMSIRLNPGELGELKIQVSMENNKLNVQVHADNNQVKDLLLSNLDALREALSGKNLSMDGFNVSTGGGAFDGPLNEEKGNQRQQQGSRFARNAGYEGQDAPKVNYLTAEVNSLLDVRF